MLRHLYAWANEPWTGKVAMFNLNHKEGRLGERDGYQEAYDAV